MKKSPSTLLPRFLPFQARRTALVKKISHRAWRIIPEITLRGTATVLALFALFGFNPRALAFTDTWTGADAGPSTDWATGDNWVYSAGGGPTVASGDSLVFTSTNGSGSNILTDSLTSNTFEIGNGGVAILFTAGAPAYTMTGNAFELGAGVVNDSSNTQTIDNAITLSATHSFNTTAGGGNITIGGIISGVGFGVTAAGGGTVTLNASTGAGAGNSYTGTTMVNSGTLELDFTAAGAPTTNIVSTGSPLTVDGGTLLVNGLNSSSTETFSAFTVSAGNSIIDVAGSSTLNLGATFTYTAGSTLEFIGVPTNTGATVVGQTQGGAPGSTNPATQVAATGTVLSTSVSVVGNADTELRSSSTGVTNGANLLDDGFATVGLYDFAIVSSASPYNIVGASQGSGNGVQATNNDGAYELVNNGQANATTSGLIDVIGQYTGHATSSFGGVRFNVNGTASIYPNGTTDINPDAILLTPNVGEFNDSIVGGAGNDVSPGNRGASASFAIIQNNTLGFFDINATLEDSRAGGNGPSIFTQSGAGTVDYLQPNFFTGSFYLNGGTTEISADNGLGASATGAATELNGGTILATASFTLDNGGGATDPRPITLLTNGGALAALTSTAMTVDGVVSGAGTLVIGIPASSANGNTVGQVPGTGTGTANTTQQLATGTVVLSNASNSNTGGIVIDSGILQMGNASISVLGTGGITLNGSTFQWGSSVTTDISPLGVTLAGNGTFDTNGNNVTLANSIGNGGPGRFTKVGAGKLTVTQPLTSTGGVTVTTGSLSLGGANTYTASTQVTGGTLVLPSGASLGTTPISVSSGTLLAQTGNNGVGGNLSLGSSSNLSLVDGAIGALTVGGTVTVSGTGHMDFELDTDTDSNDSITINGGALAGTGGSIITIANLSGASVPASTEYTLITDASGLGTINFTLGSTTLLIDGNSYALSLLSADSNTEEVLKLTAAAINFYWAGGTSASWSAINNFDTDATSGIPQTGSLGVTSNVFLTANTASNFSQTLDGNYAINSLTFTGATANSISLANGTGSALKINASNAFADSNTSINYAQGIGLVVEANSVANTISANVSLGASQTWEIDNSNSNPLTVTGVIADGTTLDSLTKTGPGTLILSTNNTYDGGTIVSGGRLRLATNNALLPAGALTVETTGTFNLSGFSQTIGGLSDGGSSTGVITSSTNAGTLTINNSTPSTFSGTITDNNVTDSGSSLSLDLIGSSTVTLSGANSYSGLTTVSSGTLIAASNSALGSSTSVNGGLLLNPATSATVDFTSANPSIAALASSGAGTITVVLGNSSGAGSPTTLTIGGGDAATSFTGVIADKPLGSANAIGNLVVNGGSLVLAGADTFAGTTSITGGSLILGNSLALQDSMLNYNNGGGIFSFGSLTAATLGGLEGNANISLGAVALTVQNSAVSTIYTGTLSDGGAGGSLTLNIPGGTSLTLGSGANGAAIYTGATTVNSGTLIVGGTSDLTGALNMTGLNGTNGVTAQDHAIINAPSEIYLSSAAGGSFAAASTFLVTGSASVTAPSLSFGNTSRVPNGASVTVAQAGSLLINGPFTLESTEGTTASNNTVNLNGGTLGVDNFVYGGGNGTTQLANIQFNGGTLEALSSDPTPGSVFFLPLITGVTTDVDSGGAVINTNGFSVTIASALVPGATTGGGLTVEGTGTLILTGANTYTGTTNINGGILNLGSAGAIADSTAITFGGGTLQYSTANTTDYSSKIINSTGPIAIGVNGQAVTFLNPLSSSNTGGLTVADAIPNTGSLTINGANAYTGPTTINSGAELILPSGASITSPGTVTVNGTLLAQSGNAGISGNLTLGSGSTLSLVGDSATGLLTVGGNMIIGGTGAADIDLQLDTDTPSNDSITIDGASPLAFGTGGGVIYLTDIGTGTPAGTTYTLITDANGMGTPVFSLGNLSLSVNGQDYLLTLGSTGTTETVTLSAANLDVYWAGGGATTPGSWSDFTNFVTEPVGGTVETESIANTSNVFLTANTAANYSQTLDGTFTINSLSFTGTGTGAASNSITLAAGTGSALTIRGAAGFSDANGNNYPMGTGLVVQPGSAAHTISANIDLANSQTWDVNNSPSNPLTMTGVIADGGTLDSLTKSGTGTLILANANTYDGGTTVNNGTLMLGTGGSLAPTGSLTVSGTGTFDLGGNSQTVTGLSDGGSSAGTITASTGASTLTVNNITPGTYSGTITDNNAGDGASLALVFEGTSNVTLSGSSSFTGGVTLASGTLTAANNYALGSPSSTNANAGLLLDPAGTATVTAYFNSANPTIAALNTDNTGSGEGTSNVILGNTVTPAATTLNVGAGNAGGSFFSGTISDLSATNAAAVGNLNVYGGANLFLEGADTFTGTTTITGAGSTISVYNALALQDSTLNYNNQGGTLAIEVGSMTLGGLTGSENFALTGADGAVALTIGNTALTDKAVDLYTGNLTGAGSLVVNMSATGSEQIGSGANGGGQYTGSTTVNGGTLILGGNTDLTGGAIDLTGDPTANGGTGVANGLTAQGNAIIVSTSELFLTSDDGGGANSYAGPSTLVVTGTASVTAPSMSIGNVSRVESGSTVTVEQNGSLTINGNIALLSTEGGTASTTTINLDGGTLTANSFSLAQGGDPGGQLVNFDFDGGVLVAGASDNAPTTTFLGALSGLTANVQTNGAIINTNGFNITIAAALHTAASPDGGLTKRGLGTLTLTGSNTYNGPTTINAGVLSLGNAGALAGGGNVTFGGGTLQYSASNNADYSARIVNSTAGAIAIDLNGQTVTFATPLASSNTGGFTLSDSVAGTGSLTVNGTNAYGGATAINSGAELILPSGASLPTSPVTVTGGTLLAQTGNNGIGGSLALGPGGTLSLNDQAIGSFTVGGAMTLTGTNSIDLELNTNNGTSDTIDLNGGSAIGGAGSAVINLTNLGSAAPSNLDLDYVLIDDSTGLGTPSFTLGTGSQSLSIGGLTYTLNLDNNGTEEIVVLTSANLNYYWKGGTSASWSSITNFATDHTGLTTQGGSLLPSDNVFLTTDNAGNFSQTLDGSYAINSLSFTGTGTGAATNSITLANGTGTNILTINAASGFGDANSINYPAGTGLVVQAGSAAHTISANIDLGASQTWDINNSSSNPLTVSGAIADGSTLDSLTKSGPGTLVLSGTNTYDGGTIVNGGRLRLGTNNALLPTGALTVETTGTFNLAGFNQTVGSLSDGGTSTGVITSSAGASTLTVDNSTPNTYSGTITSGAAVGASLALNLEGSSSVTLSGSNSFVGGTTISSGTLTAANNYALGSPTSATGGLLLNPSITGTATVNFTSANPNIAALESSVTGTTSFANVVLGNSSGLGTPTTLTVGGGGNTTDFYGNISDKPGAVATAIGSLVVSGGSLTLSGSDTFAGATVINSGATLVIGSTAALYDSTLNYNNGGGTLSFGTQTATTFGGLAGNENIALVNTTPAPVALTIGNNGGTAVYSGALSDSGLGGSLTVAGGNVTLAGINTYIGTTTVTSGTTTIPSTGALGTLGTPTGAVTVNGGVLAVTGGSIYAPSLTNNNMAAASTVSLTAGGTISLTGNLGVNGNNGDDAGLVSLVSGTLTAASATVGRDGDNLGGTLPTAASTTDGLYVDGGTLIITGSGTLGVGTAAPTNSSAQMRVDAGSVTVGGVTTVTNNAAGRYSVLDLNGGTFTDNDTSGTGILVGGEANGGLDTELLIRGGAVVNTPAITLGNAADTGGIINLTIVGGTTNIGSGGIVSGAPSPTVVTVAIGSGSVITAPTIAASASWSSSVPMVLTNSGITATPTFQTSIGNNITLSGPLSGAGGLTESGAGILTLSGSDSYTGATTVGVNSGNPGAIIVSGSLTATTSASVKSGHTLEVDGMLNKLATTTVGGFLQGIGTVGPVTVSASGELRPGVLIGAASPVAGTLTALGPLTFTNSTSEFSIRLGVALPNDSDQLIVGAAGTGYAVNLNNADLVLTLGGAFQKQSAGYIYTLINDETSATGDINGEFEQGNSITDSNGNLYDILYNVNANDTGSGSDVDLELVAVPEPGTWAMMLGGLGILIFWQRSRRGSRRDS